MTAKTDNAKTEEAMRGRAAERAIKVPPDKDPLARWQGDQAALLARAQDVQADVRLLTDLGRPKLARQSMELLGQLIREAVEHMEELT